MNEIGKKIDRIMRERGISYGQLAKDTNIPKSALHRYVTGETEKIPLDRMESIAKALFVSPAYLIGWDEEFIKPTEEEKQSKEELSPETEKELLKTQPFNDIMSAMKFINDYEIKIDDKEINDLKTSNEIVAYINKILGYIQEGIRLSKK